MRFTAHLSWLLLLIMITLLFFGSSAARMGLLGNCDFAISQERLSPGRFQFYSDWLDPPSWITYRENAISSHPATRHFWLFMQLGVGEMNSAMTRASMLRRDLEELLINSGPHVNLDHSSALIYELLEQFDRDMVEKGDYFEAIVYYDPEAPNPNPVVDFRMSYPQAIYFYLLVIYNLEIRGATDLIWSDFQVAVSLSSFTASARQGQVIVKWTTANERQNLGFNLLRRSSPKEPFVEINPELIPSAGQGNSENPLHYQFMDQEVSTGVTYEYQLEAVTFQGHKSVYGPVTAIVMEAGDWPDDFRLFQNYPNPFNGCTEIRYQIPHDAHVTMRIYDVRGNLIGMLVDEVQSRGEYRVSWDGRTRNRLACGSGLYFCMLQFGDHQEVMKMILLR
ncbi:MAG: hypothetical protein AMJ92_10580 [candidate division Zixibacteria bacterium SM23_81]|nr:MAG: hypothetical protein AMJ92_10580 [candidate division Zixibacteria bacterium SM23_81]